MELFNRDTSANLLPCDGVARYYGKIFTGLEAQDYLTTLLTAIAWKNDEAFIFGKHIITKRKAAGQNYGVHQSERS